MQEPRMVSDITFYPNGVLYKLAGGTMTTSHYEMEISDFVNESLRMGIDSGTPNVN